MTTKSSHRGKRTKGWAGCPALKAVKEFKDHGDNVRFVFDGTGASFRS